MSTPDLLPKWKLAELRGEAQHWQESAAPIGSYNVTGVFNALPSLLAEVERSRALLKSIEWSGSEEVPSGGRYEACPRCKALRVSGGAHEGTHKPGCELDALDNGAV